MRSVLNTGEGWHLDQEVTTRSHLQLAGHVLHDAIDGEVIVIDLTTGTYYSLRDTAAYVWSLIHTAPGVSVSELEQALRQRYQANGSDIRAEVTDFIGRLDEEGLITRAAQEESSPDVLSTDEGGERTAQAFVAPVLEKFTDMQDLVLIDPVHDVSAAGWPHTRADSPAGGSGA